MKYFNIVTLIILLSACGSKPEPAEAPTKVDTIATTADEMTLNSEQVKMANIQTGHVEMRNLSNTIKVNGRVDVEPQHLVSVSAPLGGYVKNADLLPGQAVKKGQVLAVIENPEFINIQQEYLENCSRLKYLEQEYERQEALRKEDINAAKTFQQVTSELNIIKARISGLEQKLELISINKNVVQSGKISRTANLYASISGYITTVNVNIGKYVSPTDVLFEIANTSVKHIALEVFEKDIEKLQIGQSIRFSSASEGDYSKTGRIFLIGRDITQNKTVPVHVHLANEKDPSLVPGMYVRALIETNGSKSMVLPSEAIVQSEGKNVVFVKVRGDKNVMAFKMIPIDKGIEEGGYAEVKLPDGFNTSTTEIVIKGAYSLLSVLKNREDE